MSRLWGRSLWPPLHVEPGSARISGRTARGRRCATAGCWLLVALFSAGLCHAQTEPVANPAVDFSTRPVALVADDWCPQHCESDPARKGYIIDIVSQALTLEGVPFSIVYRPWLRALRETESGDFDGVLTPTVNGYKQFHFHREAVGYQQYCFYTNADSTWRYQTPKDLLGKRIGHLKESGFGELDTFIASNKSAIQIEDFAGGPNFTRNIFKFLALRRADAVIMTSDVYSLGVSLGEIAGTVRVAGCLANEKLAVGLSRANPERAHRIGDHLDKGIRALHQSGRLKSILSNYGMKPWRPANRAR